MNSFSKNSILDVCPDLIFCFYTNISSQIQIIKITSIHNYYWKQVIFPGQRLIFEAVTSANLEVYTSEFTTAIPSDIIPCQHLRVVDETASAKHYL